MPAQDRADPPLPAGIPLRDAVIAPAQGPAPGRALLLLLVAGYTAFVIYGSLVPLNFHPRPLRYAWAYFQRMPYLDLGIGSRADWVANILLFVPLAFLWLESLRPGRGRIVRALASCVVLLCCLALSVAIEFAQIFFPPRTVSFNDVIAEGIGALVGIVLWWSTGDRVMAWFNSFRAAHTPTGAAGRLLYAYLFLLFGYNVLPLDLTINFVEIYHKWRDGKVLLIPFSAGYATGAQRAYALLADVAIWIPAALLWKFSSPHPARKIVLYVLACAAIIELLQVFVYSRVTSTTDILTAGCGGAIGVALAQWLRPIAGDARVPPSTGVGGGFALLWMLAIAAWTGVLMVVFWYPFNFSTDWGFVHGRLPALKRVPFEAYYYGTEFRAVTEVFHKTGFFFPLGALLAIGAAGIRRRFRVPAVLLHVASALVIAGAAAGIEVGQLFLPNKNADATDWMLATIGGLVGYFVMRLLIPVRRNPL